MSHARASFAQKSAAARTPQNETRESATQYELFLHKLALDMARLSDIQSKQKKAELKKTLIGEYLPWVEGVLSSGSGVQDDVLMTMLVWACDICDFELAYSIAKHAIAYQLNLPDRFERNTATLIAGEMSDRALESIHAKQPVDSKLLIAVYELVAEEDMPDKVRALLAKAIGYACREAEELNEASQWLNQALMLDTGSGVKKDIERLNTAIKKKETTNAAKPEEGNG